MDALQIFSFIMYLILFRMYQRKCRIPSFLYSAWFLMDLHVFDNNVRDFIISNDFNEVIFFCIQQRIETQQCKYLVVAIHLIPCRYFAIQAN